MLVAHLEENPDQCEQFSTLQCALPTGKATLVGGPSSSSGTTANPVRPNVFAGLNATGSNAAVVPNAIPSSSGDKSQRKAKSSESLK